METIKFKTTIKCSSCVANVTPVLNHTVGKDNWEVDVQNPDKVLTITTEEKVDAEDLVKAIESAGYKAEKIN